MSRRPSPTTDLPNGSLRERLALLEPNRSVDGLCPDALEAQRLVLAAVADQQPLPGDVREPTHLNQQGAANEDATVDQHRPIPIPRPLAPPLRATLGRPTSQVAVASPAVFPDEELVRFTPVRARRVAVTLAVLTALVATSLAAYAAWQSPSPRSTGLAVGLGMLVLLLLRLRSSVQVAQVSIAPGGRLEVRRDGSRTVFDLGSGYAPVDELGEPTDRTWRVLIQRKGMKPFVVDRRLVRPQEFSPVLRRYRPHTTP